MQHPELPIFAFLTTFLVLIPLPWHWRARNVATLSLIGWLFIVNFIYGVNTIVWAGNVHNPAPVWCDITTKLVVGASYALPLTTLCICKHLEMVSSSRKAQFDMSDRRRRIIFDSIMCIGLPIIFMALHYIVQGHRYDIFENTGCQAALYISIPAIMLVWFPQLLFSVITLIYAVIALHHFIRRRLIFAAHLQTSNSALTTNRYLRLIAMATTEMLWGTTFTTFNLYNNVSPGLRPWTTWADVHSNFSRVDIYSTDGIPAEFLRRMMLFWWTMPASAIIFFLFFGFGQEAKKEYGKVWTWFKRTVLRRGGADSGSKFSGSFTKSIGSRRPFHLSSSHELKQTHSMDKRQLSTLTSAAPSYTSHSNILPMPTKSSNGPANIVARPDSDTFTVSSFSMYDEAQSSSSHSHLHNIQPQQQYPHITISGPHPASRPSSPSPSYHPNPSYDHAFRHDEQDVTSVAFQRPFSPPSVLPLPEEQMHRHPVGLERGILVTVHRQASVDRMV